MLLQLLLVVPFRLALGLEDHLAEVAERHDPFQGAAVVDDAADAGGALDHLLQRVVQRRVAAHDRGHVGAQRVVRAVGPPEVPLAQPACGVTLLVQHEQPLLVTALEHRQALLGRVGHRDVRVVAQVERAHLLEGQALERGARTDEVVDVVVDRVGEDPLRGVVLPDHALLAEHRDPVAHLDGFVDVVGDEDDRLAQLLLESEELVLQTLPRDRVDSAERLVHQHDLGVGPQRPGDADALRLASGKLLGIAVAELLGLHADHVEQLVDPCGDALLVPLEHLRHGRDVLRDRLVREESDLLDDVADPAAQLIGVDVGDVLPVEQDATAGRLDHPVDQAQRRALAAPGRARRGRGSRLRGTSMVSSATAGTVCRDRSCPPGRVGSSLRRSWFLPGGRSVRLGGQGRS